MLRAHSQALLSKAADKQNAPSLCITELGWEWLNNVSSPVIASGPPAPPDLMKIISWQCRAAGKACSQVNCSCLTASDNLMAAKHGDSATIHDAEEEHTDFYTDLLEYYIGIPCLMQTCIITSHHIYRQMVCNVPSNIYILLVDY